MSKIRVVFPIESPAYGGIQWLIHDLLKYLDPNHFAPVVLVIRSGPMVPYYRQVAATWSFDDRVAQFPGYWRLPRKLRKRWQTHRQSTWFQRAISRTHPDVMFFSGIGSSKLIQWSLHVDAPRIVHIHGIHFSHHSYSRVSWGFDLMETIPDMYICCAKDVERNMLRFLRVDPARLKTIYAGIDVAWFSERAGAQPEFTRESLNLPEDAFVVGAVGRVEPGKGTDLFVEAAAEVCRKHPELDIRFLWVGGTGQGRYADVISKRAWELQVEHRLDFVDSGPRPIDYVRMMDVLVSCSREEALPLVVLEAMALGKPVVGFPVGGVPEILGHGGGCLVSPFTPESLATAIEKIMMDPVLRSRLGRRGREVVETHFDIAKNVHCFESAIQEASNLTPRTTVRRAPGK